MLNMLNQFYNYIAKELISYWGSNKINKGDRFYLRLDDQQEVEEMAAALQQADNAQPFTYAHALGEPYETFALHFDDIKLVVAYTSENVKTDYLALIRNEVSEQNAGWENTALISIVSEQLDTIPGGSLDMQAEGMPLHPNVLFQKLKTEVQSSSLDHTTKLILEDSLARLISEHSLIRLTFFEFEEILTMLMKGKIDAEDYKKIGMFYDPDLDTFKGKSFKTRIQENRELYEIVKQANEFGNKEEQLQKNFTPNGAKMLTQENWDSVPFTEVYKDHREYLIITGDKKVIVESVKGNDTEIVWDRTPADTAAGRRKRHIIIFNPTHKKEVAITVKFTLGGSIKSLNKQFLTIHKKSEAVLSEDVKNSNIHFTIKISSEKPVFAKASYKHDKISTLGADFFILVLPCSSHLFEPLKSTYLIEPLKERLTVKATNGQVVLGEGYPENKADFTFIEQEIEMEEIGKYEISISPDLYQEEGSLIFNVKVGEVLVPINIDNEIADSIPISGERIWKKVRETYEDMVWVREAGRLTHQLREYYVNPGYKEYFEWEYEWLEQGLRAASVESGIIKGIDLSLSENLREVYSRYLSYFKSSTMIPSITTVTDDYRERALAYIKAFNEEINTFQNGNPAGTKGVHLFKLGTITAHETIYFTPFHPLMVAYKLKLYELLNQEELDNVILNRLSPEALIPFIYRNQVELYRPQHQTDAPLWMVLKPVNQITVGDSAQYLSKVITDKIKQFKEHFGYLFTEASKAPIQINVINLPDDRQVLKGIIEFMLNELATRGVQYVKPIEVTLYTDVLTNSAFECFAQLQTVEQVIEFTGVKFKRKDLDPEAALRLIQERLFLYRRTCITKGAEIRYAHITFYKMHAQENFAVQSMQEMKSDIALKGLYASVPAMKDEEIYKSGFGIKGYEMSEDDYLVRTAYYTNELAANTRNDGSDSYIKANTILSRVTTADEATLLDIFDHSHWVTFIDPNVDLEFFNDFNNNIVVIHYSDQYTSSNKYDAITVTNKSNQYYNVIKEFLHNKDIEGTNENIKNTIQAFNTFNGEWLLRIIGSKGYTDREKLTIISAIKYVLAFLNHPNIKWIPISLEEILRVAGVYNLAKKDGIFSAKNLGVSGPHSDDLLLLGLEQQDNHLIVHFYPVEVKFGENNNDVITKAKEQVNQTKDLIMNALVIQQPDSFTAKFYKNFFVQLLISNANKMVQGGIWEEKEYNLSLEVIEKLVKLDFEITDHLTPFIGKGAVVSFKNGLPGRSSFIDDDVQIINFSMEDGFHGIVKYMTDIHHWLHKEENDFLRERFLVNRYNEHQSVDLTFAKKVYANDQEEGPEDHSSDHEVEVEQLPHSKQQQTDPAVNEGDVSLIVPEPTEEPEEPEEDLVVEHGVIDLEETESDELEESVDTHTNNGGESVEVLPDKSVTQSNEGNKQYPELKDIRIKVGKVENSNKEIYWEYGHKDLANRHLLISGKSGQGKTYFMQCLLLEKAKQGISSIVIDYTEGFLPNQLEEEFVDFLGDRLKQQIVFSQKLPINPFTRNTRDIGGIELPETNTDIAERIKSVFGSVYKSLGIQQLNTIYDRVLVGLDRYDEKMNLHYLRELLEEDGSSTALKTLSQLRPLIDRNPFNEGDSINWKEIMENKGDVFVIQLTGYPREVQLIITEFILWDLWSFSVRNGNKHNPMPVIMDEAQNLDHREESPSARILTEGRKFGWSAWYATQFLKSQLDASELARLQNASQKIYFAPPEQEISTIASSLANEQYDKRDWEQILNNLKKGQCIVQGPNLQMDGKLSSTTAVVVNISPLDERI